MKNLLRNKFKRAKLINALNRMDQKIEEMGEDEEGRKQQAEDYDLLFGFINWKAPTPQKKKHYVIACRVKGKSLFVQFKSAQRKNAYIKDLNRLGIEWSEQVG